MSSRWLIVCMVVLVVCVAVLSYEHFIAAVDAELCACCTGSREGNDTTVGAATSRLPSSSGGSLEVRVNCNRCIAATANVRMLT